MVSPGDALGGFSGRVFRGGFAGVARRQRGDGAEQAAAFPAALEDLVKVAEMDAEAGGCGAERPTLLVEKGEVPGGVGGFGGWHEEADLVGSGLAPSRATV